VRVTAGSLTYTAKRTGIKTAIEGDRSLDELRTPPRVSRQWIPLAPCRTRRGGRHTLFPVAHATCRRCFHMMHQNKHTYSSVLIPLLARYKPPSSDHGRREMKLAFHVVFVQQNGRLYGRSICRGSTYTQRVTSGALPGQLQREATTTSTITLRVVQMATIQIRIPISRIGPREEFDSEQSAIMPPTRVATNRSRVSLHFQVKSRAATKSEPKSSVVVPN
jgi:hypothetical protein